MRKQARQPEVSPELGRVPPQAIDIEEAVLGALMLEPNRVDEVIEMLSPEAFYKPAHSTIFTAILNLYHGNQPVDLLTVTEQLRTMESLEAIGGPFHLTTLTNRIGSTANIEFHTRIIIQKHLQREVIRRCAELMRDAYEDSVDVFDLIDTFGNAYDDISTVSNTGAEMTHISAAMNEVEADLKEREKYAKQGKVAGIKTPLKELDKIIGGWKKADLVIIAARPAMGKTAFMLQIAKTAAESGAAVGIFSLEMSTVSLADRLTLSEAGIDDEKFRSGYVSQEDWQLFYQAKARLSAMPIYIDDHAGLSMNQIKSKAIQMKRAGKCSMILIDYLQLTGMKSDNRHYNREQEVSESSRTAKGMAKQLNAPVILLSQLSRASESRTGKRPMLSDLRESGSIEQDADIVIFPHRPAYYDEMVDENGDSTEGVIELIVAKHRKGPVGTVSARHNESITRIFDKPTDEIPANENFHQANPF